MPGTNSPFVLVWLELPGLPTNFFHDAIVRSIAGSIDLVLQVDLNTSCLLRGNAAIVCITLDVSKPLPPHVWVKIGGGGSWQAVIYPDVSLFC